MRKSLIHNLLYDKGPSVQVVDIECLILKIKILAGEDPKLEWLRKFIPLENGVPTHDTIGRVLSRVSAKGLQECFLNWVRAVHRATEGQIVAIDGKRVRCSFDWGAGKEAIHTVSAWESANGLVLGQLKTAEKSNKITAIPHLLELLELKGYIVTLDALGCQTEIAEKIIEKGVDYGLAVKRN